MLEAVLGFGIGTLLLVALIWWLPVILIAGSNRTSGLEKLIWILLIFFFSWFRKHILFRPTR